MAATVAAGAGEDLMLAWRVGKGLGQGARAMHMSGRWTGGYVVRAMRGGGCGSDEEARLCTDAALDGAHIDRVIGHWSLVEGGALML